ncbi:MAG: hypothetical protein KGD59_11450 [Candidatus Heimdallarchaeota archaeon]|nr:hypothetical protein [Candidatus Heimdallarchaeota archaeon]MBY8995158.1 hypothetical protein [Candidatus Heimdallarchaeota archaeon]
MTGNKYCDVCGTEQVRRWIRKQESEPSMKKRLSPKKRTVISLLVVFIILGVSVPVTVNHLLKPHYEGHLIVTSVNIVPIDQSSEQLEIVFGLEQSAVFVKQLELFSVARDKYHGSFPISFELEANEVLVVSFVLDKNNPLFSEGFSLKITHKYKVQWITYLF